MMRKLLLVWLLLSAIFFANPVEAQVTDTVAEAPYADTTYTHEAVEDEEEIIDTALASAVTVFPYDSVIAYKKQKAFLYMRNIDSLLKALQEEELRKQKKEPVRKFVNPFPFLRFLLWALAIGIVVFVIYRLFLGRDGLFASPVKNKKLEVEAEPLTDENYIDQQLNQAVNSGNYRMAIRFLYLQTLSKMADKGWLQLSPDKTNYQYVNELTQKQFKKEFARVTLHYEYAWYGDFAIGRDVFDPVKKEFEDFQTNVTRG